MSKSVVNAQRGGPLIRQVASRLDGWGGQPFITWKMRKARKDPAFGTQLVLVARRAEELESVAARTRPIRVIPRLIGLASGGNALFPKLTSRIVGAAP